MSSRKSYLRNGGNLYRSRMYGHDTEEESFYSDAPGPAHSTPVKINSRQSHHSHNSPKGFLNTMVNKSRTKDRSRNFVALKDKSSGPDVTVDSGYSHRAVSFMVPNGQLNQSHNMLATPTEDLRSTSTTHRLSKTNGAAENIGDFLDVSTQGDKVKSPKAAYIEQDIIEKQRKEIRVLVEELGTRDQELNELVKSHQSQIKAWEKDRAKLTELQGRLSKFENELSQSDQQLKSTMEQMTRMHEEKEMEAAELYKSRLEMEKLNKRVRENSQYLLELENQNEELTSTVKNVINVKDQLEVKVNKLKDHLTAKTGEMEDIKAEKDRVMERVKFLENRCDELEDNHTTLNNEILAWKNKYCNAKDECDRLQESLKGKEAELEKVSHQLNDSLQQSIALQKALFTSCEREKCKEEIVQSLRKQQKRNLQELSNMRELYDHKQESLTLYRLSLQDDTSSTKDKDDKQNRNMSFHADKCRSVPHISLQNTSNSFLLKDPFQPKHPASGQWDAESPSISCTLDSRQRSVATSPLPGQSSDEDEDTPTPKNSDQETQTSPVRKNRKNITGVSSDADTSLSFHSPLASRASRMQASKSRSKSLDVDRRERVRKDFQRQENARADVERREKAREAVEWREKQRTDVRGSNQLSSPQRSDINSQRETKAFTTDSSSELSPVSSPDKRMFDDLTPADSDGMCYELKRYGKKFNQDCIRHLTVGKLSELKRDAEIDEVRPRDMYHVTKNDLISHKYPASGTMNHSLVSTKVQTSNHRQVNIVDSSKPSLVDSVERIDLGINRKNSTAQTSSFVKNKISNFRENEQINSIYDIKKCMNNEKIITTHKREKLEKEKEKCKRVESDRSFNKASDSDCTVTKSSQKRKEDKKNVESISKDESSVYKNTSSKKIKQKICKDKISYKRLNDSKLEQTTSSEESCRNESENESSRKRKNGDFRYDLISEEFQNFLRERKQAKREEQDSEHEKSKDFDNQRDLDKLPEKLSKLESVDNESKQAFKQIHKQVQAMKEHSDSSKYSDSSKLVSASCLRKTKNRHKIHSPTVSFKDDNHVINIQPHISRARDSFETYDSKVEQHRFAEKTDNLQFDAEICQRNVSINSQLETQDGSGDKADSHSKFMESNQTLNNSVDNIQPDQGTPNQSSDDEFVRVISMRNNIAARESESHPEKDRKFSCRPDTRQSLPASDENSESKRKTSYLSIAPKNSTENFRHNEDKINIERKKSDFCFDKFSGLTKDNIQESRPNQKSLNGNISESSISSNNSIGSRKPPLNEETNPVNETVTLVEKPSSVCSKESPVKKKESSSSILSTNTYRKVEEQARSERMYFYRQMVESETDCGAESNKSGNRQSSDEHEGGLKPFSNIREPSLFRQMTRIHFSEKTKRYEWGEPNDISINTNQNSRNSTEQTHLDRYSHVEVDIHPTSSEKTEISKDIPNEINRFGQVQVEIKPFVNENTDSKEVQTHLETDIVCTTNTDCDEIDKFSSFIPDGNINNNNNTNLLNSSFSAKPSSDNVKVVHYFKNPRNIPMEESFIDCEHPNSSSEPSNKFDIHYGNIVRRLDFSDSLLEETFSQIKTGYSNTFEKEDMKMNGNIKDSMIHNGNNVKTSDDNLIQLQNSRTQIKLTEIFKEKCDTDNELEENGGALISFTQIKLDNCQPNVYLSEENDILCSSLIHQDLEEKEKIVQSLSEYFHDISSLTVESESEVKDESCSSIMLPDKDSRNKPLRSNQTEIRSQTPLVDEIRLPRWTIRILHKHLDQSRHQNVWSNFFADKENVTNLSKIKSYVAASLNCESVQNKLSESECSVVDNYLTSSIIEVGDSKIEDNGRVKTEFQLGKVEEELPAVCSDRHLTFTADDSVVGTKPETQEKIQLSPSSELLKILVESQEMVNKLGKKKQIGHTS